MPGLPAPHEHHQDEDLPAQDTAAHESTRHWVTWEEARAVAHGLPDRLPRILLPLSAAFGETLAEPITAMMPVPHYASAAIDGWAVAGEGPWRIRTPQPAETDERLLLTLPPHARTRPVAELKPGEATQVTVGSAVPVATQAVLPAHRGHVVPAWAPEVPQENHEPQDGDTLEDATPAVPLTANQDVRALGQEISPGDVLLRAGCHLNPAHIGLAASAGHDMLPVLRRPRVTVLLGFTHVVADGIPGPGEVRDVLGPQVPAILHQLGATVDQVRCIPDGAQGMLTALTEAPSGAGSLLDARAEIVVTTGGTGHGEDDHVREALAELNAHLIIDGLEVEPAHGVILAQLPDEGPVILALPGSPLSAITGLLTVGHALIAGATGEPLPMTRPGTSGATLAGTGRVQVIPGYYQEGRVRPELMVGPAMLSGLAHADVLVVVPAEGLRPGQDVTLIPLPWRR